MLIFFLFWFFGNFFRHKYVFFRFLQNDDIFWQKNGVSLQKSEKTYFGPKKWHKKNRKKKPRLFRTNLKLLKTPKRPNFDRYSSFWSEFWPRKLPQNVRFWPFLTYKLSKMPNFQDFLTCRGWLGRDGNRKNPKSSKMSWTTHKLSQYIILDQSDPYWACEVRYSKKKVENIRIALKGVYVVILFSRRPLPTKTALASHAWLNRTQRLQNWSQWPNISCLVVRPIFGDFGFFPFLFHPS